MYPRITLKRDKERPVRGRHPWIFSGAIAQTPAVADGETVDVHAADGSFVARGTYNGHSQIAVRVLTLAADEAIDEALFARRVADAVARRTVVELRWGEAAAPTTAFRLINAEADFLPGLIVDAYGSYLVVQVLTAGMERHKALLVEVLRRALIPRGIYERSDVDARAKEGLPETVGALCGDEPPERLVVREGGVELEVDLRHGQKTGYYLDQRENRRRVAELLRGGLPATAAGSPLRVLNAFAYTGAFGVIAGRARPEAQVLHLDTSAEALELACANAARSGLAARTTTLVGDAFHELRRLRDTASQFDVVILDPPKFAHSRTQVTSACRGYKDLNLLACKLLRPGGVLVTCSCSGLVATELFQKVVFDAAHDAGRYVRCVARLGHAPDHPLLLSFPQGEYLKGLVLEVV